MPYLKVLCVVGAVAIWSTAGCGKTGVVEVHRVKGSEKPPSETAGQGASDASTEEDATPAGKCPDGWNCMDIAALGFTATDGEGNPVGASCSMGLTPQPCDEGDPAGSCPGLSEPFCAHLSLGGQELVSCAQRCTP